MKRTNYKQEKRLKELEKQRKKDAKKERKLNKEPTVHASDAVLDADTVTPEDESV